MATSSRELGRHRSRSRSVSPRADSSYQRRRSPITSRTSSSHRHRHNGREHKHSSSSTHQQKRTSNTAAARFTILPFKSKPLSKHDLPEFRATFASYLDIQKQIYIEELSEDEIKGRWKSFVRKWYVYLFTSFVRLFGVDNAAGTRLSRNYISEQCNDADCSRNRGELAEGWYDPATRLKANEAISYDDEDQEDGSLPQRDGDDARDTGPRPGHTGQIAEGKSRNDNGEGDGEDEDEDNDDDDDGDIGPSLPSTSRSLVKKVAGHASGPSAPKMQDLALRDELDEELEQARREDIRFARKLDRKEQREKLDELAPRAEPGSKERQQEKRRENAAAARSFRDAKGGAGDLEEVADGELMGGGGGGGVEEARRMRREAERKKNERELRREEILRARAVEREERLRVHKEKEDKTMEMLMAIAKERFG